METKETLQTKVGELESQISNLASELEREKRVLRDVNKPTMSENVYELLIETIRNTVQDISFSEGDFDYEMSMEYDNKVELNYLNFNEHDGISDDIIQSIDNEFRVIENEENPTDND
jgi:sugar-specific transcriptional regulator TrmB